MNKKPSSHPQNEGFAGFFFKKTLQPCSLRNEQFKTPNEFKEKNICLFITRKFREIKERTGLTQIPKSIFLHSELQTKLSKPNLNDLIAESQNELNYEEQIAKNIRNNDPRKDKLNRAILKKIKVNEIIDFFVKNQNLTRIKRNINLEGSQTKAERKIRVLLHDKLPENKIVDAFTHYNRIKLKSKFERLKADKNFETVGIKQKFIVINQAIKNEDELLEAQHYLSEVCKMNAIDLPHILEIKPDFAAEENEEEGLIETLESSLKKTEALKKNGHSILSKFELNKIIQQEEENQASKLVEIFKQTHEDNTLEAEKNKMRISGLSKRQNANENLYQSMDNFQKEEILKMLKRKTEFNEEKFVRNPKKTYLKKPQTPIATSRTLSTASPSIRRSVLSEKKRSSIHIKDEMTMGSNIGSRNRKKMLIEKFENFFTECDMENLRQCEETEIIEDKLKNFDLDLKEIEKKTKKFNVFSNNFEGNEEYVVADKNYELVRSQFRFKKKIVDHLVRRIPDKPGFLSNYNKFKSMEVDINRNLSLK